VRDYGRVFSRIWESADFRALSEDGRALVLYLLTCQHGTIAGVFRVPDGYACEDLQWGADRVGRAFSELLAKGFANRCETTKWVWVFKFLEWNPPENPNQRKSALKVAQSVPDNCGWKLDFMRVCSPFLGIEPPAEQNPSPTVPQPFPNQYQEQKQEQKQDSAKAGGKPPMTPEEIIFTYGVPLLVNAGSTEKHARSFLGGLRKGRDDSEVVDVLRDCLRAKPLQPLEWIAAALPPVGKGKASVNKQEALEAQNRAVAERFLKGGADAPH
jgi:hypothetical protein